VVRGLQDTLDNPDEAFEISKKYVEGLDDSRQSVLQASLPLWDAEQLGYTDPVSWESTQAILLQIGLLDAPLEDLSQLYTNEFLPSE
jgi:NitT/TauT family transport system substrate-binding protein